MHINLRCQMFALIVLTGLLTAGCSFSVGKTIDGKDIEEQVAAEVMDQSGIEVEIECPEEIDAEEGAEFTCTADDGSSDPLDVTVVQADDDGNVEWTIDMLNPQVVESGLTDEVSAEVGPVEVSCPRTLIEVRAGATMECDVTDDSGGEGIVRATALDDEGNFDWELNP